MGGIDITTVEAFRAAVDCVLADQQRLEVDLRETTFMDSTGLAVLVAAHQRLGRNREAIVVHAPSPMIERLLDVTGVHHIVEVRP